ncbi:hypothetical protein [Moheibacter lacus]|uniref:Lipoprotein n=1 Tax=Moheibacter lacus TaxID=2745851 RepID=A0A838ZUB7_9FLAO|nr:hypothetical protein [Moheibacter lacus]MBA5630584.1 hypothetical protein [Moheibacter lacus]
MNRILIPLIAGILMVSCGEKEKLADGELSQETIESMEETSLVNSEEISYEGTFKGKINGKETELKLNGDTFETSENGKRAHGNWSKVDDGTIIELEPKSGTVAIKFYGWSDNDTWVAMTGKDSLTYIEPEQYLKRIPD